MFFLAAGRRREYRQPAGRAGACDAAEYRCGAIPADRVEYTKVCSQREIDLCASAAARGCGAAFCADEADFSNLCDVSQLPGGAASFPKCVREPLSLLMKKARRRRPIRNFYESRERRPPEGEPVVMELNRPFFGVWNSEAPCCFRPVRCTGDGINHELYSNRRKCREKRNCSAADGVPAGGLAHRAAVCQRKRASTTQKPFCTVKRSQRKTAARIWR